MSPPKAYFKIAALVLGAVGLYFLLRWVSGTLWLM